MDNQQQHDDDSTASGERKPKPVRGVGFGDIFAGGKPKLSPVDGISTGGDRHNNNIINNAANVHKAIPKKPPPPAPMPESNSDSSSDTAPVLPPKPSTAQLSLNQTGPPHTPASFHLKHQSPHLREQARVIYNYEAQNSDELTIEEGDIINVISKQIEDQGWWKGELNGQIGVFPDNFVELIKVQIPQDQAYTPDLLPHRMQKPSRPPPVVLMGGSLSMVMPTDKNQSQSSTPKGLSRDLETNSDKGIVGSSASFLSLNRNKFGGISGSKPPVAAKSPMNIPPSSLTPTGKTENILDNRDPLSLYNQSKDCSSLSLGIGGRTHASTSNSFDSFISTDSNSGQTPGKLNHLTAQRAKGPSSRRPPSYILQARDNMLDNSADAHQNGDIKDVMNHSRTSSTITSANLNQSSMTVGLSSPSNASMSQQNIAINANMNSQQTSNKSVTPPSTLRSIDSNQNSSSTKTQKSPHQQKETTPTSALPHWMVELREKTTKKAHSEKAEKKRDSTTEDPHVIPNNNLINNTNAKQAESPIASTVAPVKSSPPFSNRDQPYQQTPTSSLTGGVKNLTSRYSGDFTLSDKGIPLATTQNPSNDQAGSNEITQGASFKQQSTINASLHGKTSNNNINNTRPTFTPVSLSSTRQQDVDGSSQLASEPSSTHLIANNQNVPISNNISSTSPLYHGSNNLNNHANSTPVQAVSNSNQASQQLKNSSQNASGNKFLSKNNSPSDSPNINEINFNSAQQNLLKQHQQQIVLNNSEIENLKEEIKWLKDEIQKAPTRSDYDSLAKQVSDLRSLIENQKKAHGNLIKDLINDLADERKKTATMQIEIDRLQKLTSAV